MENKKSKEENLIKIPEENIVDACDFTEINTTKPSGAKGAVEELDKALKNQGKTNWIGFYQKPGPRKKI